VLDLGSGGRYTRNRLDFRVWSGIIWHGDGCYEFRSRVPSVRPSTIKVKDARTKTGRIKLDGKQDRINLSHESNFVNPNQAFEKISEDEGLRSVVQMPSEIRLSRCRKKWERFISSSHIPPLISSS